MRAIGGRVAAPACGPPSFAACGGATWISRRAKYTGLHALRHFYASRCINREVDGGLGLPAKLAQERLGHSSITMTLDTSAICSHEATTRLHWPGPKPRYWREIRLLANRGWTGALKLGSRMRHRRNMAVFSSTKTMPNRGLYIREPDGR